MQKHVGQSNHILHRYFDCTFHCSTNKVTLKQARILICQLSYTYFYHCNQYHIHVHCIWYAISTSSTKEITSTANSHLL